MFPGESNALMIIFSTKKKFVFTTTELMFLVQDLAFFKIFEHPELFAYLRGGALSPRLFLIGLLALG
jgi:hypothetical protein